MANNSTTVNNQSKAQDPASNLEKLTGKKVEGELKRVLVEEIVPDPKQPRKTFYKISMEELEQAIKSNGGILQSLLLRKHGNKYMIIFGERRWRAAKKIGIKEVPAMIIEATNERALSLQLLENLQRENLIPMEQAIGFKQLAEECKMTVRDIALSQGKPEHFVRQQITLTDLIPQWQKILSKNAISLTIALQIAVLPEKIQKDLYQNNVNKDDEKADKPHVHISQNTLNQYKGILLQANFDITDSSLDPKAGPCTTCPFNSACNSLFPEESQDPRCNNIVCFNNKSVVHLNREFTKAKDDPTVLLVYDDYQTPDYIKKIKGEGLEVLKLGYADDCKELKEPQKPEWKEFEKWAKRHTQSEKEIKKEFKKAVETYEFNKEVFDKNVASGKYKKAFVVYDRNDRQTGKYVYVEMNDKKPPAKKAQEAITEGTATVQDIQTEITRLQEREARAKELDEIKIQEKIVQALEECKSFHEIPKTSNRTDNALINFLLIENISYSSRSTIEKVIKLNSGSNAQFYKSLESLSRQQVSFLVRQIILAKYGTCLPTSRGGLIVRKMAEALGAVPIAKFEKEQKEKATKRQNTLKLRIGELNKHKQQIATKGKTVTVAKTKSAA